MKKSEITLNIPRLVPSNRKGKRAVAHARMKAMGRRKINKKIMYGDKDKKTSYFAENWRMEYYDHEQDHKEFVKFERERQLKKYKGSKIGKELKANLAGGI